MKESVVLSGAIGGAGAIFAEATVLSVPAAVPTLLGGSLIAAGLGGAVGAAIAAFAPAFRRTEADEEDEPIRFAVPFDQVSQPLRAHCEDRFGPGKWDTLVPAYLFGWDRANRPDLDEIAWDEVVDQLRADWSRRHPELSWSVAETAIRAGWERARTLQN